MKKELIDFNEINQFKDKNLFLGYLNGNYKDAYAHNFDVESISKIKTSNTLSKGLIEKISKYNNALLEDYSVDIAIEKLKKENTSVIITGQQPHLYSSPLYTTYKALTAILTCKKLNETTDKEYVAMFWNGSDDHDLDEVNRVEFPDKKYGLFKERLDIDYKGCAIYDYEIKDKYNELNQKVFENLRQTEFRDYLNDVFLKNQDRISDNVSYTIKKLFSGMGLVVLEPKILREFSRDVYKNIVQHDNIINKSIAEKGEKYGEFISRNNQSNLFYHNNGKREKIEITHDNFYKVNNDKISKDDFANFVYDNAEKFSPGVTVRPVVQDYLFPTAAYIGGPGEIGYFSQLKGVYEILNVDMPAIKPRVSATLVTPIEKRLIDKYGFNIIDVLNCDVKLPDDEELEKEKSFISNYKKSFLEKLDKLSETVKEKGNEILQSINSSLRKIEYELNKIDEKYVKACERDKGIRRGHIEKLFNNLVPNQGLQERTFSPIYYLNFYGENFIKFLSEQFEIDTAKHHVIYFE